MDIEEEKETETIVVEPVEDPVKRPRPERAPEREPEPAKVPAKVGRKAVAALEERGLVDLAATTGRSSRWRRRGREHRPARAGGGILETVRLSPGQRERLKADLDLLAGVAKGDDRQLTLGPRTTEALARLQAADKDVGGPARRLA